jgi:O-acetyl-ADP-ribose deacetylase (regulator of RNase III)
MALKYVTGDATRPEGEGCKVIVHCCNDIGQWGSGFVVALSKRWDRPEERYRYWHRRGYSPKEEPLPKPPSTGTVNYVCEDLRVATEPFSLGCVQFVQVESDTWVANLIGQHETIRTQKKEPPIRYTAILEGLSRVLDFCTDHSATVHAPRFGAGLAGGSWSRIEALIYTSLVNHGVNVTIYDLPRQD